MNGQTPPAYLADFLLPQHIEYVPGFELNDFIKGFELNNFVKGIELNDFVPGFEKNYFVQD